MNLSPEIKKQYFNTPQMEAMYIAANTTVIVGGPRNRGIFPGDAHRL